VKNSNDIPEKLFISFSPGFNRVIGGLSDFPKPFQRFTCPVDPKTVETVRILRAVLNQPVETG